MKKSHVAAFGVVLCMAVAIHSIHRFVVNHVPIAFAGQCIQMHVPDLSEGAQVNKVLKVIENNIQTGEAVHESPDKYIMVIDYAYIRKYNGTVVECPTERK